MRLGFIVILIGALYLLRNTHLIAPFAWDTLWPIILILIGIAMVGRRGHGHGRWCDCNMCAKGKYKMAAAGKTCDCACDSCQDCDMKK